MSTRILTVEDDQRIRELVCRHLAGDGYGVTSEGTGLDGLRALTTDPPDALVLDLGLPDGGQLELFSFPSPPPRPSRPEAQGLRHLAFRVTVLEPFIQRLAAQGVACEPIRVDEYTGRRFTFFADPDDLPLELYEVG